MEKPMFQPLGKERYFEQIAELMRKKIFQEDLREGFKLPSEQQLAQELGVSRSVVREALRILNVMGHVKIKKGPRGGIFVSASIHKPFCDSLRNLATNGQFTVEHLFDVRFQIEPYIVEEATRNATPEDIQKLLNLKRDAAEHIDDAAYLKQKNMEFHYILAEVSGNPVLTIVMKSLMDILLELNYDFLNPVFEEKLFQVHSNIIEAIAKRKIGTVGKLVRDDILFVKENLKQFVDSK
jgi:DNA-binding FadR family transcriptional regulator